MPDNKFKVEYSHYDNGQRIVNVVRDGEPKLSLSALNSKLNVYVKIGDNSVSVNLSKESILKRFRKS